MKFFASYRIIYSNIIKDVLNFNLNLPTFHIAIWLSLPAVNSTFKAVGCQSTKPTLLWWYMRSTTGSVRVFMRPWSGICHTLTTQSSEPLAMMLSLWGHHAISRTGPLWPPTRGWSAGMRPTYEDKNKVPKYCPSLYKSVLYRLHWSLLIVTP